MGIFYFGFVPSLCFISLLNLNYMLSPPKGPVAGDNYRLISQLIILAGFTASRLFMIVVDIVFKLIKGVNINKNH